MKRQVHSMRIGSIILAFAAVLALSACKDFFQAFEAPARGSITVATNGADDFGAKTLRPIAGDLTIATYYYHLVGPGGVVVDGSDSAGTKTFADLIVGSWTVAVTAKNASAVILLASAAVPFTVSQGQASSVTVPLVASDGTGTVSVTLTLPDFVTQVTGTRDDNANPGNPVSINANIAFTSPTAVYTDSLQDGTYLLVLSLKNIQGNLVGMIIEDLDVFAGVPTAVTIPVRDIDLNQTPVAPASLTATAGDGQASLEYSSIVGATGYNVYYRVNSDTATTADTLAAGSPFTNLSPTITGLYKGTKYAFVVTAINFAGEGVASAVATMTTPGLTNYGLVSEYLFSGNPDDTSGNANTGAVYGATLSTDRFGATEKAYNMDGVDDYISISNTASYNFSDNAFTLNIWVKYNNLKTTWSLRNNSILSKRALSGGTSGTELGGFYVTYDAYSTDKFWYTMLTTSTNSFGVGSPGQTILSMNEWYFVSFIHYTDTLKIYVNGSLAGAAADTGIYLPGSADLYIGRAHLNLDSYSDAKFDDLRIYDRALSESEIQALYQDNGWPATVLSYNGNGNTAGAVPASANYGNGATATVSANTGSLVKMQDGISLRFAGWNTQANGGGTAYAPGATLSMGAVNVELFAQWSTMRGTGPGGGLVFFDKGSVSDGWRYLEAAPSDQSTGTTWYNGSNIGTGASGTAEGTGAINTAKIRVTQGEASYAAGICADLSLGGKNDWYLPSSVELDLMRQNLHLQGVGGFAAATYWTSSETGASNAWSQHFSTGVQADSLKSEAAFRVRAARAFRSATPTHAILYYGNGSTGGSVPTDANLYEEGESVPAAAGTMTKQNYNFAGWNTSWDGTGTYHAGGSSFAMGTDNAILYGQWIMNNWSKTYGGSANDGSGTCYSMAPTSDGGFIVIGQTTSWGTNGDGYAMKLDSLGDISWQKAIGSSVADNFTTVRQLSDGGYIIGGDISTGSWANDIWIGKLDSSGNIVWQKQYDNGNLERIVHLIPTSDGGFIFTGGTGTYLAEDLLVVKLNSSGVVTWQKRLNGGAVDWGRSIIQTGDGGYIVAGIINNSYNTITGDAWIIKLDSAGAVTWQKRYAGSSGDEFISLIQTSDGGFIATGHDRSYGAGVEDAWIVKLDSSGNISWQKTYGGSANDQFISISQTLDGGYLASGSTSNFGAGAGASDRWTVKIDSAGIPQWQRRFGGNGHDGGTMIQLNDGSYIGAGNAESYGAGGTDIWILKLTTTGTCPPLGTDTNCTVTNSSCVASDTSVTPTDANFTVTTATLSVTGTAFTVTSQAPVGSSGFTMTGGLLQDYAVNFTVTGAQTIPAPNAAGYYPLYTITQAMLPITVSVSSTPTASAFQWLLDGGLQASATSSVELTTLNIRNHTLTLRLKSGSDSYRSATIILKATE